MKLKFSFNRRDLKTLLNVVAAAFTSILFLSVTFAQEAQEFRYENDVRRYEAASVETPPTESTTFFVGSSTFTRWKNVPQDFAEFDAVNRGFGGSQISDWLNVAADRLLTPYKPRRVVFFCGGNDIASGKSVAQVVADFQALVDKLRAANPEIVVHFCALTRPPVRKNYWEKYAEYNAEIQKIADADPKIFYVDFATPTCDADGAGRDDLFLEDRLHLTRDAELLLVPRIIESIRSEIDASKANEDVSRVDFLGEKYGVSDAQTDDEIVFSFFTRDAANADNISNVFLKTRLERSAFDRFESASDGGSCQLYLKSGESFIVSEIHSAQGFLTIDYLRPQREGDSNEEPLVFEAPSFDASQVERLKAFGTAGLKPIDGHNGSYAFLALVDPTTRSGLVGGWITSEKAGGVVRSGKTTAGVPTMTPRLDYGALQNADRVLQERFVVGPFDDCRIGLEQYAEAIAQHYSIIPKTNNIVGYCTWYSDRFGGACNEVEIKNLARSIVENFGDFGFQYVQIDDKWQLGASKNGPNKNFTAHNPNGPYPSGMSATSKFLNENGLTAGIWFMPFSGNFDDPYFADKQDLFVRSAIDYPAPGEKNTRRYSSINQTKEAPYETFWGGTSLDLSNPKTREYVRDVVSRITQDWNYKYIKIDGMWVGAGIEQLYVNDEYAPDDMGAQIFCNPQTTNVENFRTGLQLVRDAASDVFILGCNVSQNMRTLAASYGLVDAMRVGPDNGSDWQGVCAGPWRGTNRYFYNGRVWWNDPDPVYARRSIPIERARVSATWASLSGQLFALSDWIPDYDAARIDLVRKTIPNHLCKTVRPVDLFDEELAKIWLLTDERDGVRRDVVGLFNWNGSEETSFALTPEKLGLPTVDANGNAIEKYVGFDFWDEKFIEPFSILEQTLPAASCRVVAVRPVGDRPILLSSSRHISQGILEVREESWNPETQTLKIVADVPPKFQYELRVFNPATGALDRWTAPAETAGTTTFEYKTSVDGAPQFSVVQE